MNARPSIDVSGLKAATMDHRSPIWWGNLLMIAIETTAFALLVGAYFYLRGNFSQWPPPQSNAPRGLFDPVPALFLPTVNLAVILLSCLPMLIADRAALHLNRHVVEWALGCTILVGLVAVGLRFVEFRSLKFRWDDNAYGSVTWTILGMHLLHLIIGTLENVTMFAWLLRHGLDHKHARDIHVTAIYWYWVAAVWVVLFAIVFPGPRFF